ncbi:MAG TPA: 1,2-phenylacetyl-CoA epoxidase subunit PaaC [Casimicrobiaceae bacterium]|jgi:ring-1,2-phenylacetyl-CoA epoxidase subunit PaaC|nr:1,2-phenylacetyl-CoA epoxidase subunit PaaC [Casimicrobiaceae bacterium]
MEASERFEFLLRLGDSPLVLAQRLSEWVGKGPVLEEDIALTNVGLDLLGQARLWLAYAGEFEGEGRDEDALAFRRDAHEFRNALLAEQPNGDYAETTARQFLFDHWHALTLRALERSHDERVAAIAAKASKEVAYHVERSTDWVIRLGDGTELSHRRMQAAIDGLWMYAGELFLPDAVDDAAAQAGIGPDLAALAGPWRTSVAAALDEATLTIPADDWAQRGGRQGRHTEHLGHLLTEMQFLQRAYPDARW